MLGGDDTEVVFGVGGGEEREKKQTEWRGDVARRRRDGQELL